MTTKQIQQFAAIVSKADKPDWRILHDKQILTSPGWDALDPLLYSAERIAVRDIPTPLTLDHYQRFMLIRTRENRNPSIVLRASTLAIDTLTVLDHDNNFKSVSVDAITEWAWPTDKSWQPSISIRQEFKVLETLRIQ